MKITFRVSGFVLGFLFLLASCGPVTPVPSATPTATVTVTTTQRPTAMALTTVSPEATTETGEILNVPEKELSAYQLQTWFQDQALRQVDYLQEMAWAGQLESYDMFPLSLAKLQAEILIHDPDFSARNAVLWDLVRNDPRLTVLPASSPQADLLAFLVADVLNQQLAPLSELADYLSLKSIWMDGDLVVQNGVGAGIDVTYAVFRVGGDGPNNKAIFAIWQEQGAYRVERVTDWEWDFGHAHYTLLDGGDVNKNGIRELVWQLEGGQSGDPGYSSEFLYFYEWSPQAGKFLFHQQIPVFAQFWDDGPAEGEWELPGTGRLITRSFWKPAEVCSQITIEHRYQWNGEKYLEKSVQVSPPDATDGVCRFGWAEAILAKSELGWHSDEAMNTLEDVLKHWPEALDDEWGPAIRDYYKLELGLWRDYRGEAFQALKVLDDLAQNPTNSSFTIPSQLASTYLAERQRTGFAKACLVMDGVYQEKLKMLFPNSRSEGGDALMLEQWGFLNQDSPGWPGEICEDNEALPANIQVAGPKTVALVPDWLTQHGFTWYQKFEIDLNDDAHTDLLMSVDTYYENNPGVWLFFQTENGVKAILPDRFSSFVSLQVSGTTSTDLRMTLLADPNWIYSDDSTYFWSKNEGRFNEEDPFFLIQQQIEIQMYQDHDYLAAIEKIKRFLETEGGSTEKLEACGNKCSLGYIPYFRYLLGVAYELSGQPDLARQAFYELWRDYPKHLFGIAASQRLAPIQP